MEVLNKNQRQSAIWRLVGLGLIVLVVNAVILTAIHRAYANQGSAEVEALKSEIQKLKDGAKGGEQGLRNQLKAAQAQMNVLKTQNEKLTKEKTDLTSEYKLLKTRSENLERDLDRCIIMSKN